MSIHVCKCVHNGREWGEWAPYDRGRADKSLDEPMQRFGKAAAEAHGIHLSMASRIRRGEAWRPLAAGASVFCQG